uniref:Uncharacterized protein n=1 Tax=viral metagenome TaxID=1070528 RepID=A0A6M3JMM3_9ZZZZ
MSFKLDKHRRDLRDLETSQLRHSHADQIERFRRLILAMEEVLTKMPTLRTALIMAVIREAKEE